MVPPLSMNKNLVAVVIFIYNNVSKLDFNDDKPIVEVYYIHFANVSRHISACGIKQFVCCHVI